MSEYERASKEVDVHLQEYREISEFQRMRQRAVVTIVLAYPTFIGALAGLWLTSGSGAGGEALAPLLLAVPFVSALFITFSLLAFLKISAIGLYKYEVLGRRISELLGCEAVLQYEDRWELERRIPDLKGVFAIETGLDLGMMIAWIIFLFGTAIVAQVIYTNVAGVHAIALSVSCVPHVLALISTLVFIRAARALKKSFGWSPPQRGGEMALGELGEGC